MMPLHYIFKKVIQSWGYINLYDPKGSLKEDFIMYKYNEKFVHAAISGGLSAGEFAVTYDCEGHEILAVNINKADRKGGLTSFTVTVNEKEVIEDNLLITPGFYPVRSGGKTRLAFVNIRGEARFLPSEYSREVRLSGGLIDLDEVKYRKEVIKHLDHLEAENRGLRKELLELHEELKKSPTRKGKNNKATQSSIDEEVEHLLGKKPTGGLKYVPPKDDDDDRLY